MRPCPLNEIKVTKNKYNGATDFFIKVTADLLEMQIVEFFTVSSKQKKIRFIDDDSRNPDEDEKDTRLKYGRPKAAGVTPLQAKMLKLAGQQAPAKDKKEASF